MKVAIVNDTSSNNHFGCKLVMDVFRDVFKKRGVRITGTIPVGVHWARDRHSLETANLVVVNGEGSIHDGKYEELIKIAGCYPSVLVNTSFQNMPSAENLGKFKYISVRESFSQRDMSGHGVVPEIVPDLIFAADLPRPNPVYDRVSMDSVLGGEGISPSRCNPLEKIGKARSLCTGRFHGACMALKWGMPFSAYPSNTHKTLGMMTDAGCPHLYFETQEEAEENIQPFDGSEYVANARIKIEKMFDRICDLSG